MTELDCKRLDLSHRARTISLSYFERLGPRGPILCLHGMGCSKGDFSPALDQPALQDFRLIALDFPGCGGTEYSGELDIEDLAEITASFISAVKAEGATVIGHSLGGAVGLLLARRYGDRLGAFINIEGNLAPEDCFFSAKIAGLGDNDRAFDRIIEDSAVEFANSAYPGTRAYADHLFPGGVNKSALRDYSKSLVRYSRDFELLEWFIGLSVPRLFIYGSENKDLSYIPRLRNERVPVAEIPESQHWPHLDNPSVFYGAVADFGRAIKQQDSTSAS